MLKARKEPDLAEEAFRSHALRQFQPHHLDGDVAIVLQIAGKIDPRHAARAEGALDVVPVTKRRGELVRSLVHVSCR